MEMIQYRKLLHIIFTSGRRKIEVEDIYVDRYEDMYPYKL